MATTTPEVKAAAEAIHDLTCGRPCFCAEAVEHEDYMRQAYAEAEVALKAAAPVFAARWQALKVYLAEPIADDEAVRVGMVNGETELAAPFGDLVSANRSTLAKMRELEAGR